MDEENRLNASFEKLLKEAESLPEFNREEAKRLVLGFVSMMRDFYSEEEERKTFLKWRKNKKRRGKKKTLK